MVIIGKERADLWQPNQNQGNRKQVPNPAARRRKAVRTQKVGLQNVKTAKETRSTSDLPR
ncbi:hypothetical protein RMSM_03295 [Rhodopirellula maiorica SM1]|uniref:Uncharacterized protein n=1 Tax=Rhodopirellula maiorica SM1 TaxID=1265738 RepID=M5RKG3_9BACT|nr:hypothetical protein RMSM_03295 [Rhodopirellula maiorica SM1]